VSKSESMAERLMETIDQHHASLAANLI